MISLSVKRHTTCLLRFMIGSPRKTGKAAANDG